MNIHKKKLTNIFFFGALLIAAFFIYLPSELGAALTIPPDSSEYAISLANFFEHGRFGFTLNGEWYPSRYAPWFSLLCLTPAYFLSGGNVLCVHWAILGFALMLLTVVWKIGKLCGLGKLSIFPPILLMFMPDFLFYSRIAMTEIPYSAFFAMLALMFLRFANLVRISARVCVGIGMLIACAGLVRSTGYFLAVPFVVIIMVRQVEWKGKFYLISTLGAPILLALLTGMIYNWITFGSPFRTGYHYWCAVPVDFPRMAFNWNYVVPSIKYLLGKPIIQATIVFLCGSVALSVRSIVIEGFHRHLSMLLLEGFILVHVLVLSIVYLGYYWFDVRFFLPIAICSVPLFFLSANEMLLKASRGMRCMVMVVIFILSLMAMISAQTNYLFMTVGRPIWLAAAQISGVVLPDNSIVIQRGDPIIIDFFGFREKRMFLLPFRREFDYTIHMTAPRSISNIVEMPSDWRRKIIPSLVESGICRLPFPNVFTERPSQFQEYVSNGRRVFYMLDKFAKKEYETFKAQVEDMGFELKLFGAWNVPRYLANPVRHLYDGLLFPGWSMDSRSEIMAVYYEIVPGDAGRSDYIH